MKKTISLMIIITITIALSGCKNNQSQNTSLQTQNVEITKTSTASNDTALNLLIGNNTISNTTGNNTKPESTENSINTTPTPKPSQPTEKVLYEYSTKIKSKSANRLNNIKIACSDLNGTTVNNKAEFSFTKTVGKATTEKGYKKADVIVNHEVEQAIGGGMCQVSSTLYNALLGVSNIKITERHPHGKTVNYVEKGKDAAISYGSKDLKFINNSGNTIKIYASADSGNVYIKIVAIT